MGWRQVLSGPFGGASDEDTNIVIETGEVAPTMGVRLGNDAQTRDRLTRALYAKADPVLVKEFLASNR